MKRSKKKKEELKTEDNYDGWAKVIRASGDRMRKRSEETREANKLRATAIQDLPLDDIFHEVATQTSGSMADVLREMIGEGPKTGLCECPDAFTVALVRAANFWYQAAKDRG